MDRRADTKAPRARLVAAVATIALLVGGCLGPATTPSRGPSPTSSWIPTTTPTTTPTSEPTASPTLQPTASPTLQPTAPPTAQPTLRPTPKPTVRPTPRPTLPPSVIVSHGSRTSGTIALTFDMGGRTAPAVAIMSWLRDHGIKATIFMTGQSLAGTTAARLVAGIINARPDLFDLGNHSDSHPDLRTMTVAQIADELRRAEATIGRYATQSPRPLFRPPYGAWDADVLTAAGSLGYRWTVLWDVDTIDWKPISDGGPTAEAIMAKVLAKAQAGSIVLMHLGGYETLGALPGLVSGLQAKGYRFVTLAALLGG
ncbi:MAG: hypothetical protein EPN50_03295 [Chloroflexota bacterium]|nr:MAG: hypothetical protein EPN50_03295 [Chloroflexota bacterium]